MQQAIVDALISAAHGAMDHAVEHLSNELVKVRTGKASPAMLGGLMVSYYGTPTPLSQVANVSASDARTLTIQPWEKSMLAHIEKAIFEANLGVTPNNDGEVVRISIPPLTEERRKEMVKKAKSLGEEAKISARNARHKALDGLKKAVKDGYPEDLGKKVEHDIQEMLNQFSKKIDHLLEVKEKDIMTV